MISFRSCVSAFCVAFASGPLIAQTSGPSCSVKPVSYQGWSAQEVSNSSVKLTIVPQLGGRLIQVEFEGHPYLFVNPKFAGKYVSPQEAAGRWINYGGDKIWPMPEGNEDEQHWVLESSAIDDMPYAFKVIDQGETCKVQLDGPVDEKTGLQYSRQISIDAKTSAIHFHAVMRNATSHTLQWSVQSVSQYDLASHKLSDTFNRDFWAYTELRNPSAYLEGYHVRSGLVDGPSFSKQDDLFRLHWTYFENEVWVDSAGGWLAVADGENGFGMIERFHFDPSGEYPGKATVIFYQNGPSVEFDDAGNASVPAVRHGEREPFYMEAEINSPLITLEPNATYGFDTTWYPLRTGVNVVRVTEAGLVNSRLQAVSDGKKIKLSGMFSVAVPGKLQLRLFRRGRETERTILDAVSPKQSIMLAREIEMSGNVSRVALHLLDESGSDWGIIDDAEIETSR